MTWTNLTYVDCSVLTAAKMTALQGNFAALAAGEPGAPPLRIGGVSSLALVHAASGFAAPQVSSFGTLHTASGMIGPGVSSLAGVAVGSAIAAPGSHDVGHLVVNSGIHQLGMNFPHFALLLGPGNPPTIHRQIGVSSVQRHGTGIYEIHLANSFASSDYFLTGMPDAHGNGGGFLLQFDQDSSTGGRVMLLTRNLNGTLNENGLVKLTALGFG